MRLFTRRQVIKHANNDTAGCVPTAVYWISSVRLLIHSPRSSFLRSYPTMLTFPRLVLSAQHCKFTPNEGHPRDQGKWNRNHQLHQTNHAISHVLGNSDILFMTLPPKCRVCFCLFCFAKSQLHSSCSVVGHFPRSSDLLDNVPLRHQERHQPIKVPN